MPPTKLMLGFLVVVAVPAFILWLRNRKRPPILVTPEASAWGACFYSDARSRDVAARFILIVSEHSGAKITQLTPDTTFIEDLNLTDLEPVEILMATEEEFKIEFSESDAASLISIGRAIDYISGKYRSS